MENWRDLLGLVPLLLIVVLAIVLIRGGRKLDAHGDDPPDNTGIGTGL